MIDDEDREWRKLSIDADDMVEHVDNADTVDDDANEIKNYSIINQSINLGKMKECLFRPQQN